MSELRRHARELLDTSRRERTPSVEMRERVLRTLMESAAQTSLAARQPPPLSQRLGWGRKALVLTALVVAIALGMWAASRAGP